mgnify:CR=1 FL=1
METSPLKLQKYDCDQITVSLKECTAMINDPYGGQVHEEYKVILLRAGMNPEDNIDPNLEVCKGM